jgi:hypothetical protein
MIWRGTLADQTPIVGNWSAACAAPFNRHADPAAKI